MEIIAHRGASYDAPENTLAAITLGWEQQADAVEIDVHLCLDNEIIVMHDANTLRTTGVEGEIARLTLDEMRRLDAGSWKSPVFQGEPVPALAQALELLPEGKTFVIEIKGNPHAIIAPLQALLAAVTPAQILLIGFDYELMKAVKAALPKFRVLWLLGNSGVAPLDEVLARCRAANFDGLNLSHGWPIDEAFVRQVKAAGLLLYVWTVDDSAVAHRLAAAGVDGITTNRPGWLREQLQQMNVRE